MLLYNWLYKKESMSNVSNTNYGLIYCTYHLMLSYNTFMSSSKTLVVYLQCDVIKNLKKGLYPDFKVGFSTFSS